MSEISPHVSILIPVQNEEAILTSCVASWCGLMDSLKRDCELLFIDDGSTDLTLHLLEELQTGRPFLRYIRNSGKGQHHALADGIAAARGRVIITSDADLFPAAADLAEAVLLAESGGLVVMRREFERGILRQGFSLANNGLLSFLRGSPYHDIGSMQMCFPTPAHDALTPLPHSLYLPLKLEAHYKRMEIPAHFADAKRPSRYSFKKLAGLLAVELQALGDLPDIRRPQLLSLLNAVIGRISR